VGWCENLIGAARVGDGERVLVVVDEPLAEEGSELAAAVADAGGQPELHLWAGERPLAEPPPGASDAARRADVGLALQQAPRGDEAFARSTLMQIVTGHGGRMLFLGFVDGELLRGDLSQPQPNLEPEARRLLDAVAGARELRVTGTAGTDLTMQIEGRPWLSDAIPLGPGDYGNFPGGEIFVSPLEDGVEGALVADITVPYTVEGRVDEPVSLVFERGRVTSIEGGRAAEMLRDLVARSGDGADVIAELGIGLNPAVSPRGHVMLDEKAAGTAHVAIGNNTGYGGVNRASIHVDCVFSGPEVAVDGRPLRIHPDARGLH
jgi:hypothetical protein